MTQPHTPGPWRIGPHPGNGAGTAWRQILSHSGPFSPALVCEAIEPDARLIAAAPDLLAALVDAVAMMDAVARGQWNWDGSTEGQARSTAKDARAAIAKATGA